MSEACGLDIEIPQILINKGISLTLVICILGETSLKRIHNFLMHNAEWIEGQLDIPPLIGSPNDTSSQPEPQFRLNIDPVPGKIFNPLHECCHISDCKFDHVSSIDSFILFKYFIQASY